ncbi:MAG TPA: hypothetical protein EYP22_01075 [Methanosarcinales archaeon]|nr:hypothetical protein [Methanosarcinales archaeon]
MTELISFSIEDEFAFKLKNLSCLWNLEIKELARKLFIDGFKEFEKISLDFALKQVEEGKAEPEDMAALLNIDLEEFEDIAVERGIMDDITLEDLDAMFKDLETLEKEMGV